MCLTGQRLAPHFLSGAKKVDLRGRTVKVNHVTNAHAGGDSRVNIRDANVLATGDHFSRNYPNLDWGSGRSINGMNARPARPSSSATPIVHTTVGL